MTLQFTTSYIEDSIALFRYYKGLAERAIAQVTDEQLFVALDAESNSIAIVVKHLAGNMRSRWTGFPEADGEKPDRNRDTEFAGAPATRPELLQLWESGWNCLFTALEPLTDGDLGRTTGFAARRTRCCRRSTGRLRITVIIAGRLFFSRSILGQVIGNP